MDPKHSDMKGPCNVCTGAQTMQYIACSIMHLGLLQKIFDMHLNCTQIEDNFLKQNTSTIIILSEFDQQVQIQRGGQGVRTPPPPWKITSYMGFYRK